MKLYLDNIKKLYETIQEVAGCNVIIDSSKVPSHAYLLNSIENFSVYNLHVTRDSRAVSYSLTKRKARPEITNKIEYMPQSNFFKSSMGWLLKNVQSERFFKSKDLIYKFIRYEDFVNYPNDMLSDICNWIGEEQEMSKVVYNNYINLETQHTVSGNPMRFKKGQIQLNVDNEWLKRMKKKDSTFVTLLTWPLLIRYNYLKN